jgi:Ser/Thr protein kinase RdoA (MazF antagonist)
MNGPAEDFPGGASGNKFVAMSYRIQVHPEAGSSLRTMAPHLVLRLGPALADLAESLASGKEQPSELRVDDWVMQIAVDHARRLLEVIGIEQREPVAFTLGSSG